MSDSTAWLVRLEAFKYVAFDSYRSSMDHQWKRHMVSFHAITRFKLFDLQLRLSSTANAPDEVGYELVLASKCCRVNGSFDSAALAELEYSNNVLAEVYCTSCSEPLKVTTHSTLARAGHFKAMPDSYASLRPTRGGRGVPNRMVPPDGATATIEEWLQFEVEDPLEAQLIAHDLWEEIVLVADEHLRPKLDEAINELQKASHVNGGARIRRAIDKIKP